MIYIKFLQQQQQKLNFTYRKKKYKQRKLDSTRLV